VLIENSWVCGVGPLVLHRHSVRDCWRGLVAVAVYGCNHATLCSWGSKVPPKTMVHTAWLAVGLGQHSSTISRRQQQQQHMQVGYGCSRWWWAGCHCTLVYRAVHHLTVADTCLLSLKLLALCCWGSQDPPRPWCIRPGWVCGFAFIPLHEADPCPLHGAVDPGLDRCNLLCQGHSGALIV
jgi:hypothetical protein